MRLSIVLCAAGLFALAACDQLSQLGINLPTAANTTPKFPPWGFDLAGRNTAVKPGDDFFRYAGGTWMANTKIPEDRVRWGVFDELRAQAESDVRTIAEDLAKKNPAAGTNEQKAADFYKAFMDTDAIEKSGMTPATVGLNKIANADTHEDIARLIADPAMELDGPIDVYITLDEKNPDRYVIGVGQSGLSLPDREYYLKTGADFVTIRTNFRNHVANLLRLAGSQNANAEAASIAALEAQIARLHWEIAKRRERELTYNPLTFDAGMNRTPSHASAV